MAKGGYKITPRRRAIALRIARQYPELLRRREEILHGTPAAGPGGGHGTHRDPTAVRGIAYAQIEERITAIEKALERIPAYYRAGVLDNVLFRIGRERLEARGHAGSATWQRQRERFLFYVALFAHIR